jgi:signal transduction histidine kinase
MNAADIQSVTTQSLKEFINQCPFGLIQTNPQGEVILINAFASQLLFPVAMLHGQTMDNIWSLLREIAPDLVEAVAQYELGYGHICDNERVIIPLPAPSPPLYLSFSIIRLNEESYQVAFKEVSNVVQAEKEAQAAHEEAAIQAGKAEIAASILHDIGNAITGVGSSAAKLNAMGKWPEISHIHRLKDLFAAHSPQLDQALGAGKGAALIQFLTAVEEGLQRQADTIQSIGHQLLEVSSHVREILNLQRQYARGKGIGERAPIRPADLIDDAFVMLGRGFEKREIRVTRAIPYSLPLIAGDKTKLIQVFVNLLKNAAEAYDELEDPRARVFDIQVKQVEEQAKLVFRFSDNATGIAPARLEEIFSKGETSKSQGSGLGLYNCKQIIESHGGQIWAECLDSGPGTRFVIQLPYNR